MARIKAEQPLVPSVLDRLLDDEPEVAAEPPKGRSQVLRELKLAVRRDLENLLNTRARRTSWPAELTELKQSLLTYGLPDITGGAGDRGRRDALCRTIEAVVRRGEPRFVTVRVGLLGENQPMDRTLRFRIDALLRADPAPEPVVFDSILRPSDGTFEVKGTGLE